MNTLRRIRVLFVIITAVVLPVVSATTNAALAAVPAGFVCFCADSAEHERNAERLKAQLEAHDVVGAQVVLIHGGKIADIYSFGYAHRADKIKVNQDTLFRIASVTKMVSAIGVLKIWEEGLFDLDGDLSSYFDFAMRSPYYKSEPITIRQIMTHTASLLDGEHYKRALNGDVVSLKSVFTGAYAAGNFSRAKPGTVYAYSNFGGGLLGSIMELFTGKMADDWMRESVYDKLGLTASYFTPLLPEDAYIARIYDADALGVTFDSMASERVAEGDDYQTHYTFSAASLSISAYDLAKILLVVAGDGSVDGVQILKPETVAAMRTLQNNVGSVSAETNHGLNLNIIADSIVSGRTLYGHQGKAYGMICAAYCDPTDQSGVVMLTNGCDTSTLNSVSRTARDVITAAYRIINSH